MISRPDTVWVALVWRGAPFSSNTIVWICDASAASLGSVHGFHRGTCCPFPLGPRTAWLDRHARCIQSRTLGRTRESGRAYKQPGSASAPSLLPRKSAFPDRVKARPPSQRFLRYLPQTICQEGCGRGPPLLAAPLSAPRSPPAAGAPRGARRPVDPAAVGRSADIFPRQTRMPRQRVVRGAVVFMSCSVEEPCGGG